MALPEYRKKSNAKYQKSHPSKAKLYSYRSHAKTFIKEMATVDELKELRESINAQLRFYEDGHFTD